MERRDEGVGLSMIGQVQTELDKAARRQINGWKALTVPSTAGGISKKETVLRRGTMNLDHYLPVRDEVFRTPLFFVMATTNRAYILDLLPGQSMIEFLLNRGYDIYVLDWTAPSAAEKTLRLEDYIGAFIPSCIAEIGKRSGEPDVTLIGYCMGGVLALIYAALEFKGPVRNLVCLTTPFNWSKWGMFNVLSDPRFSDIDGIVDRLGNVPAELIVETINLLRPASRFVEPIRFWDNLWNDEYVRSKRAFDKWGAESLPLAGEYARQITKELLIGNKLFEGTLEVGGKRANVGNIAVPFLQVVAEHDHIVGREATQDLLERVGSTDKQEIMVKGGHVSVAAGGNAVKRLWPALDKWLEGRST